VKQVRRPFSFSPHQLIVYRYFVNVERAKYIVWAAELSRAVNFYRTAFNASILRQSEILSELEIAGATIGIHAGGEGQRTWTGLSFQVADVVAGAQEVVAAGGQLLKEPMSDTAGEPPHLAMCTDTEGNEFMLTRKRQS
jgi:lactoylglutathione lyase